LALAACGGSTTPLSTDAAPDATGPDATSPDATASDATGPDATGPDACVPLPCPSNAPWDPAQCKCVQSAPIILHASDYDQTCTTAADCIVMTEGNICPCSCPNAAISKKDEAREEADTQRALAQCEHDECGACAQS